MIICAREECEIKFARKTHNQIYCSDDCCKIATNARVMREYYKNQARLRGAHRVCEVCEKTKLSRYNKSSICSACSVGSEIAANRAALDMMLNARLAS